MDVPVMFLLCEWQNRVSSAANAPNLWPQYDLEQCFTANNAWSLRSYWDRCSLGARKLNFQFHTLGVLIGTQEAQSRTTEDGKTGIRELALEQARSQKIPVDKFKHHVIFVNPAPNNAGAAGDDVIFDVAGMHAFYAHELGHLLGLGHPFGWPSSEEYADPYCLMGYTDCKSFSMRSATRQESLWPHRLVGPDEAADNANLALLNLPAPRELESRIGNKFWRADRMPAAATMHKYWSDFADDSRVQTRVLGFDAEPIKVTLTALSEYVDGATVLLVVQGLGNQEVMIEYRKPTKWDYGITTSAVVVHAQGLLNDYSRVERRDRQGKLITGRGSLWFHGAIEAPYYDEIIVDTFGIEVIAEDLQANTATVEVRRPAYSRVELLELQGRMRSPPHVVDKGGIWLNRDVDQNLCSKDFVLYECAISEFAETVYLDVSAPTMNAPRIEEAFIDAESIPAGASVQTLTVHSTSRQIGMPASGNSAGRSRIMDSAGDKQIDIDVERASTRLVLTNRAGAGSFSVNITAIVVDTGKMPTLATTRRVTRTVHFTGDAVEFEQKYRDDSESCWWTRVNRRQEQKFRIENFLPPHVDASDKLIMAKLRNKFEGKLPPIEGSR